MACGSACCGPAPISQPTAEPTSQSTSADGPGDVAKPGPTENMIDDTHDDCSKEDGHVDIQSACCDDPAGGCQESGSAQTAKDHIANIDGDAKNNQADACCSSPDKNNDDPVAPPDCCDGTTVPCCGDACIDRLALRACNGEKQPAAPLPSYEASTRPSSSAASVCEGIEDGKPCGHHTRVTRANWASTREALGCICRALLALGQESCCAPKELSSIDRKRGSKRGNSRQHLMSRSSSESCCSAGNHDTHHSHGGGLSALTKKHSHKHSHKHGRHASHSSTKSRHATPGGCCGPSPLTPSNKNDTPCGESSSQGSGGCCGEDSIEVEQTSCCGDEKPGPGNLNIRRMADSSSDPDLEKGSVGYERAVVSVTGMTCTGCEKDLERVLLSRPQVKNLQTSLFLSRAIFDVDTSVGSVEDVLKYLKKNSKFRCELVKLQAASLDVIAPGDPAAFAGGPFPKGVGDMTILNKTTVSIAYEPEVIGARDLIERGWSTPLELAPPRGDPTLAAGAKHVRELGWMVIASAILTIPVLVMAWEQTPTRELRKIPYGIASLVLATIVQGAIAGPFYPKALKSLIYSRVIEMDLLIVLSTTAAYIFSVVAFGYLIAGKPLLDESFFETSTLLVTLIVFGRWIAAYARHKAVESISVRSLQAGRATLSDRSGKTDRDIDARLLQYGDIFKVVPESKIPTDGTVVSGVSEVDESMITGEAHPVEKRPKSTVVAGTMNGSGTLLVQLSRLPGDNTITTIADLVDGAKMTKPKIQDLADKVAGYFVPVVLVVMVITLGAWLGVGLRDPEMANSEAAIEAVKYAITVLIVSCPCAIGLAVPMVIVIGTGVAAKYGVVIKSAGTIEIAHKTTHAVFDKTGTLTTGKLSVEKSMHVGGEKDPSVSEVASLLLGLVQGVKHPVSSSIAAHLTAQGVAPIHMSKVTALPGKGVEGRTPSGVLMRAGNSRWLNQTQEPSVEALLAESLTVFCVTIDNVLVSIIGLRDTVRPEALDTVSKLQKRGISVHIVSGDDEKVVAAVAQKLCIPEANIRARCSPVEKNTCIQELQATRVKGKPPVVLFVGDGTNDAVALAQADIGVAIVHSQAGLSGDVAKSAADVVLTSPRVSGVLTLMSISRKSVHRIWFNFGWSFVYNVFAILLAGGAFVAEANVRIPPQYAGLGELGDYFGDERSEAEWTARHQRLTGSSSRATVISVESPTLASYTRSRATSTHSSAKKKKRTEFLLPSGRRIIVALPSDVDRLRRRHLSPPSDGTGTAPPPVEVVLHGSPEHLEFLSVSRAHHAARHDELRARVGHEAAEELERYFHRGLLWRSKEQTEVMSFELFFDLMYVGILAFNADHVSEDAANSQELLRFIITFIMSWKIWADVQQLISWFETNDILQRVKVLFLIACLLGQTTNMLQTFNATYDTFTQLVGFYLTARLFIAADFAVTVFLVPSVRGMMITQIVNILAGAALWIGATTIPGITAHHDPTAASVEHRAESAAATTASTQRAGRLVLIFLALAVDNLGPILPVALFRYGNTHTTPLARRISRFYEFYPAINIEHKVERTNAFVSLVFGYSVVAMIFQNAGSFALNAFLGKAVLGLTQAYLFNWLYFEVDGANIATHAIRRSHDAAVLWTYAHLAFVMAYVLGASALSMMVVATDVGNAPRGEITAFYQHRSREGVSLALRLYYCVGFGVALIGMALISLSHEHKLPVAVCRVPKWVRLCNRLGVCVVLFCLPAAGDRLNSLELIGLSTGLMVWVLSVELWGKSCKMQSFVWADGEERCRYTARCAQRKLEDAMKSDGEVDVVELGREEKTGALAMS
ncbi:E1-E2 ATPase-domain-containing protein [Podospora conica]|nr:E1-E2 ATPase-domain-containing protein [Schizothecium conicum]